jgi:carboxyl-terminal processing protease
VRPLRDGYGLKYTIARYYTPSGRSIQAEGIHPDLVVKRRLLDETSGGADARRIKEEDLKNHLPGDMELKEGNDSDNKTDSDQLEKNKGPEPDDETDVEKLMRLRDAVYEHSDREPDALLLDSQVNRAYEILRGYEIFSAMRK